jgi:hypothetical protein
MSKLHSYIVEYVSQSIHAHGLRSEVIRAMDDADALLQARDALPQLQATHATVYKIDDTMPAGKQQIMIGNVSSTR